MKDIIMNAGHFIRVKILMSGLLLFCCAVMSSYAQTKVIWEIGASDNLSAGMALAPADYKQFLAHDFGWEDRFYLIGYSKPEKDWSYVLPGPKDSWGGTASTSGIRSHFLNILFGVDKLPARGDWKLLVDILGYNVENPPLFKVKIRI